MRGVRATVVTLMVLMCGSAPAWADATAFLGASTNPTNRTARGVAIGTGLLAVGVEFEYSATAEDATTGAAGVKIGSGNALVQTPVAIHGVQPYFTMGGGICQEQAGTSSRVGFASNVGGGAKISLAGPLRLRIDYRVFTLGAKARYSPSHRLYAGVNLKF